MDSRYAILCFEQAAQPAFNRVARDRAQVEDAHATKLLRYLAMHLFDPDFSVRGAQRKLGIKDNNFSTAFGQQVGETPALYVKHRRLETAIRLLCVKEMTVSEASNLLGFRSLNALINAFRSYAGIAPGAFQKLALRVMEIAKDQAVAWHRLEGILGTELSKPARNTFLQILVVRFPHLDDVVPSTTPENHSGQLRGLTIPFDLIETDITHELPSAQLLWKDIAECKLATQIEVVKERHTFKTPALFYLVREASRVTARDHAKRGMELAKLALLCARILECERLSDSYAPYQALAWSWIGNLRGLSLDFEGAEQALRAAEFFLPPGPTVTKGEWCHWKAHLRWYERRLDEASVLCDEAVDLIVPANSLRLHCEARIFRAIINSCADRPERSIPDLHEALRWLDPGMFPVQCFSANYELTQCLLASREYEQAADRIEEARSLNQRLNSTLHTALFRRLEGLVDLETGKLTEAEVAFRDARVQMLEIDRKEHVAVIALDLAVLYARTKQLDKAALVAAEALPMLKRLSFHDVKEMNRVLELITKAGRGTKLDSSQFEDVREATRRTLQATPTFVLDAKKGNPLLD